MSRFVIPVPRSALAAGEKVGDNFPARLVKYLPAELVALYTAVISVIASAKPPAKTEPFIASGLILVGIIATIRYVQKAPPPVKNAHLIASPIAFVAWSYAVSSALLGEFYVGWIAAVGQGVSALLAWAIAPHEE